MSILNINSVLTFTILLILSSCGSDSVSIIDSSKISQFNLKSGGAYIQQGTTDAIDVTFDLNNLVVTGSVPNHDRTETCQISTDLTPSEVTDLKAGLDTIEVENHDGIPSLCDGPTTYITTNDHQENIYLARSTCGADLGLYLAAMASTGSALRSTYNSIIESAVDNTPDCQN